jgi:gluconokinase
MITPRVIVLMGVAGVGKTTVGTLLAERLGWRFHDADDFHPPENIAKMASGIPLNEDDREPWLMRLRKEVIEPTLSGDPAVLACSALKASYRKTLGIGEPGIAAVFIECDPATLSGRLEARTGHYMKPGMLASQLDSLEVPSPAEALHVSATLTPAEIVDRIFAATLLS